LAPKGATLIVRFLSRSLEKDCADDRSRQRAFGAERAKRLRMRLSALAAARCLDDMRNTPGRFHALTADYSGKFALDLDGPYRLIFEPMSDDEGKQPAVGSVDLKKVTSVRIIAIKDYHG
jgi:proteic killer suppression protein